MNDKHKGPHCAGSCEGAAYLIKIRGLEAENAKLEAQVKELSKTLGRAAGINGNWWEDDE